MDWGNEEESLALDALAEPLPTLDDDERTRLRDLIGPGVTSAPARQARDHQSRIDRSDDLKPAVPENASAEDRLIALSFVLSDIDRKIDKLSDAAELLEQLSTQVGLLSERIARIERVLIKDGRRVAVRKA